MEKLYQYLVSDDPEKNLALILFVLALLAIPTFRLILEWLLKKPKGAVLWFLNASSAHAVAQIKAGDKFKTKPHYMVIHYMESRRHFNRDCAAFLFSLGLTLFAVHNGHGTLGAVGFILTLIMAWGVALNLIVCVNAIPRDYWKEFSETYRDMRGSQGDATEALKTAIAENKDEEAKDSQN